MNNFVSFNNHTTFSLMQSLIEPASLFKKAKELGQSAIAVTDYSTLAGAWDSLKFSKEAGVKLIIGCEFYFVDDVSIKEGRLRHIILCAKNATGYKNLLLAIKLANDNHIIGFKKVIPRIDWKILELVHEGLICTTACGSGILSQLFNTRRSDDAKIQAKRLKDIFGDNLALEIQPHAMKRNANLYNDYEDQGSVNRQLIKLGDELDIKVIPTFDSHYLTKDQWEAHDVLLAIGSGQPIKSGARLKYDNEFYLRTRDEVRDFFARLYPTKAEQFCDNTLYFADKCEIPEWIDPKFSNPSGKELPVFHVHKQSDLKEFQCWMEKHPELLEKTEDSNYLRFLLDKNFKCEPGKEEEYRKRIEKELEVLEMKDLCSYMLIVADYVNWAKKNDIPIGTGRGCSSGNTPILTESGFKEIKDIKSGEKVYTHTGNLKPVLNTMVYSLPENEEALSINVEFGLGNMIFTKDHKLFGSQFYKTKKECLLRKTNEIIKYNSRGYSKTPTWISASEFNENQGKLFVSFPNRIIDQNEIVFDLANYCADYNCLIKDETIEIINNKKNTLSIRDVSRKSGVPFEYLRKRKNKNLHISKFIQNYENKLSVFLLSNGFSVENWINEVNYTLTSIKRFIKIDDDFAYLLGRWVGDGCFHNWKHESGITILFNSNDNIGIKKISDIVKNIGFNVNYYKSKHCQAVNLTISNKLCFKLFKEIFCDYKRTSDSKHLPEFFRKLNDSLLNSILLGIIDSDGFRGKNGVVSITTTSNRLAFEIKEILLYLKNISSIKKYSSRRYEKKTKDKYLIFISNILKEKVKNKLSGNGYFSLIRKINTVKIDKVYDISVEDDHSYLTMDFVAHNSVGGSLVAYLLGIHEADSIKYDLLFERFFNKAKEGLSDIDCDFGQEGKPLVEKYVIETYGQAYCAQVSNFSTLTPKPYVKAIARAFMFGGDQKEAVKIGAAIADIIPKEVHSVEKAFETVPLLDEYSVRYPQLKQFAKLLGNKPYNFATHAGAIIIGKRPLVEIVPLRCTKDGDIAIEYEKERAEANGLAKMDLLGLSNLDIIKSTISLIKLNGKTPPQIPWNYDENDTKTYNLIGAGDNFGVFQLGKSGSTVELCKKIKPKNILDLAIINALARPGVPKDVREKFIEAKMLNKEVAVFHPSLKKAFAETLGFALYDEVLLQLGQDVAGWDLNEADRLRKFVKDKGKYPEKDKKLKKDFIDGAIKNRIPQDIAAKIWNDIVGNYGSYAFNKSHAVNYSFLSYQTAYLKAHFPLEFLVSNLNFYSNSNSLDAKDNILKAKGEVRKLNIKILPPDINNSLNEYKIIDRDTLLTGLKSLKFIGKDAIPEIIAKRPFKSFEHFLSSVDGRKVKAPAVQALAASGCLDSFGLSRKLMFLYAADYKKKLSVWLKNNRESGKSFNYPWPEDIGEWTIPEQNAMEISYLGEGLTGTVYQVYPGFFDNRALNFTKLPSLFPEPPKDAKKEDQQCVVSSAWGTIEGIVKTSFEFKVKKEDSKIFGETMARVIIQDPFGNSAGMTIFPKKLKHFQERLKELKGGKVKIEPGTVIHIAGSINWYEGESSILFDDLKKCEPPPIAPKDLKPKKVSMKITSGSKKRGNKIDPDEILSEIEDELIEEGLAESSSLDDDLFEKDNFVDHLEDFV